MSRPLNAAITAELQKTSIVPVWFVSLGFSDRSTSPHTDNTLYLHTDLGDITTLGQTWLGAGDLGSVGTIEEAVDMGAVSVSVFLSGVDSTLLSEALNNDYQQRPITIYVGVRNTITGALTVQPHEIFAGKISEMRLTPTTIELVAESELALWDRAANLFYTDTTQQRLFPAAGSSPASADLGLIFVPRMTDLTLKWGEAGNQIEISPGQRWFDDPEASFGASAPQ